METEAIFVISDDSDLEDSIEPRRKADEQDPLEGKRILRNKKPKVEIWFSNFYTHLNDTFYDFSWKMNIRKTQLHQQVKKKNQMNFLKLKRLKSSNQMIRGTISWQHWKVLASSHAFPMIKWRRKLRSSF